MSVLKLKDKEIKGFQVHFEDEHWTLLFFMIWKNL